MALVPPNMFEYDIFVHGELPDDEDWAVLALQQATDLFWLATGLAEYPSDPQYSRIAKNAIMEMAQWLLVQDENKTEIFSPYNSERIGSYSYSKLGRAENAIHKNEPLGLFWWDKAISLFYTADNSVIWSVSEKVIPQPYEAHELVGSVYEGAVLDWKTWDDLRDEAGR